MIIPFTEIDKLGIIEDVRDYLLPPNAWSAGKNVRFHDGSVEKMRGSQVVFDPPTVAPYWLLHTFTSAQESVWIYGSTAKVYNVSGGTHTNITRQTASVDVDYAMENDLLWNGGVLAGVPILNNGVDLPQFWATPLVVGTKLANLTNWPAGNRCRVMRPYKNYLVAMDMTESGTRFMHRVRISHAADPGGIPSSWDDTDPLKDAIKKDLTDTWNGPVIDGAPLRDVFVVYKERATHGFQFIGGRFKWRNFEIFDSSGLMSKNCVTPFDEGRMHFVVTGEDVIVHNLQQRESIIERKQLRWLQANMDPVTYKRSFVVPNLREKECWFCFPLVGSAWPNVAMIWHRETNTLTFRDIDLASFISLGAIPADSTSDVWDSDTDVWDADLTTWDQFVHPLFERRLLQAKPTTTDLLHLEVTEQFDNVSFEAFVERTGLTAFGVDRFGKLQSDTTQWKNVRSIYPRATGGPINVYLGTQDSVEDTIVWSAPEVFTPGQERPCVDFAERACRLYGVRFQTLSNTTWSLSGWDADVEPLGRM